VLAIGWGTSEGHEAAKDSARMEDPAAADVLRGVAS
jgi:hypothetical protein